MGSISFINKKGSGGNIKFNIFAQETEPLSKNGIWIKSNKQINKIQTIKSKNVDNPFEWTELNVPIPTGRYPFNNMVTDGEYIYIIGAGTCTKFNLKTREYTPISSPPADVINAVLLGEYIYFFGTTSSNLRNAYKYNINTDEYTSLPNMPYYVGDAGTNCVVKDNYIYIIGIAGHDRAVVRFNTADNTYVELAELPETSNGGQSILIGNTIYTFAVGNNFNRTGIYKYDINANSWTKLENANPDAINFFRINALLLAPDIYIFIEDADNNTTNIYKFDTVTETISKVGTTPVKLYYYSTIIFTENKLYTVSMLSSTSYNWNIADIKTIELNADNAVIIELGNGTYTTNILDDNNLVDGLPYSFDNVYYNSTSGGLDESLPTYYGTGTEWVKFKN